MEKVKTDPRILRTRKLIVGSFERLSKIKSFSDISVTDITKEAMINRATFYNHFLDKYDLLEQLISEQLNSNLNCSAQNTDISLDEVIKKLFLSLTSFEKFLTLENESQAEIALTHTKIRSGLINIFTEELENHSLSKDKKMIEKLAVYLTNNVINISDEWNRSNREETAEEYIDSLLPIIQYGVKGL